MAQPVNTFDTYDQVGIREDLADMIYDISPDETPFYSNTPKTTATQTFHEWQTDALRAPGDNAHIEGDDTVAVARAATVRLGNYTQIFKDAVVIPGTDRGINKAGRGDEMDYQMMKVAKEQKLDIERSLFANQARVAGSGVVPRRLAGVPSWINTNTNFQSGAGGADPTGNGTNARTDDGTPTAFSQTKFDNVMQLTWSSGGKPDTVYLAPFQMNLALGFTGNNNQRSNVNAASGRVIKNVEVYMTPWGQVTFQMVRDNLIRARDVFVMQSDMWGVAVRRGTFAEDLAKTGDSRKRQVITELTLECRNEAAHGGIFDNTVA